MDNHISNKQKNKNELNLLDETKLNAKKLYFKIISLNQKLHINQKIGTKINLCEIKLKPLS